MPSLRRREHKSYLCTPCFSAYYRNRKPEAPDGTQVCIKCNAVLTTENWGKANRRLHTHICRRCYNKRASVGYYTKRKNLKWVWQSRQKQRESRHTRKFQVLAHYGNNGVPQCMCCGEKEFQFLSIDHIVPIRRKRENRSSSTGDKLYLWLIRNGYPKGFQTLCMNCNWAKGFYGRCPHQVNKEEAPIAK